MTLPDLLALLSGAFPGILAAIGVVLITVGAVPVIRVKNEKA